MKSAVQEARAIVGKSLVVQALDANDPGMLRGANRPLPTSACRTTKTRNVRSSAPSDRDRAIEKNRSPDDH